MTSIVRAARGVVRGNPEKILALFGGELAHHLGGRSQYEGAVGKNLAFGDDGAGADQTAPANHRGVQYDRLDADQRAFTDRAAMQHRLMADGDMGSHRQRKPRIRVQNRSILHIAVGANADGLVVTAQGRAKPHGAMVREDDLADDRGTRSNIRARRYRRGSIAQLIQGHIPSAIQRRSPYQPPYRSVRISAAAIPASIRPCEAASTNGLEPHTKT